MKIKEVLAIERSKDGQINLCKEGLFWRAYNGSAYLFVQHFCSFKLIRKFIKSVDQEVVYLGFPESKLPAFKAIAEERELAWLMEEKRIGISGFQAVDPAAYQVWFDSIEKESAGKNSGKPKLDILERIRRFPILEKSPLETQQFLIQLQKEINGYL